MNILFGITGSVSAYKAIELIRLFIKDGHNCRAIVTKGGQEFIKPQLLVALGCDIYTNDNLDMYNYEKAMSHISLSRWADKILIIPASANTIAKVANGIADDLLTQTLLANLDFSKVSFAPAMNTNMWQNSFTQENIKTLKTKGYNIIEPASGVQACGDIGKGRLAEPQELFELFSKPKKLAGLKVLITVGATVEDIDGVRFLSNYSSGKMGLALINELVDQGAKVTVLKANTSVEINSSHNIKIIETKSADSMNNTMLENANENDIFIGCAAVADYKIKDKFTNKIKKTEDTLTLEFIKNPDILKNCKAQFPQIFAVGFAAESQNLEEYALTKLEKKKLDMIIANDISVLGQDNSSVIIFTKDGDRSEFKNILKSQVAKNIVGTIYEYAK